MGGSWYFWTQPESVSGESASLGIDAFTKQSKKNILNASFFGFQRYKEKDLYKLYTY